MKNDASTILIILALIFSIVRWQKNRTRLATIFSLHQFQVPTLHEIQSALLAIQDECNTYILVAERVANILFCGERVCVVSGSLRYLAPNIKGGSMWRQEHSAYVIARAIQSNWMQRKQDVFTPAAIDTDWTIYFVKLDRLVA
ncbi:MAG: hypothetical protein JWL59_3867 [Chthoniobacteraceae bacterium]|nr:hypothetical protein [Chthoniobacteraceae bacterium]